MNDKGYLTKYDWLLFITVFLGWAVSGSDIVLNAFFLPQITKAFHIPVSTFGLIVVFFGVGDGLGGFIFGRLDDLKWGRKLTFLSTLLGVMVFTGLSGLSINFPMFLISRLGAGIFSGGEMTTGWILLAETVPIKHRNFLISLSQGGVALGYGMADLFASTFAASTALGWRYGFYVNALFAVLAYFVRLSVRETPYWSKIMNVKSTKSNIKQGLGTMFNKTYRRITILAFAALSLAFFATAFHDDYYVDWYDIGGITRYTLTPVIIGLLFIGFEIGTFMGNFTMGLFMDKIGVRKSALLILISVPSVLAFYFVPVSISYILDFIIMFMIGYGVQLIWGFTPAYLSQIYPTRIRHSGEGFVWAVSYGLFYSLGGYLGGIWITANLWYIIFIISAIFFGAFSVVMFFTALEFHGKPLDFLENENIDNKPNRISETNVDELNAMDDANIMR